MKKFLKDFLFYFPEISEAIPGAIFKWNFEGISKQIPTGISRRILEIIHGEIP